MNVNEAIAYLRKQDLVNMDLGRYDVDDDFYYMVQEYTTQSRDLCRPEAHEKWIDIQWMLKGTEVIETADISKLKVTEAYNPEKDIVFYETPATMQQNILTPGAMVVLYPENGHMPKVATFGEPCDIKKVVAKIKVK